MRSGLRLFGSLNGVDFPSFYTISKCFKAFFLGVGVLQGLAPNASPFTP